MLPSKQSASPDFLIILNTMDFVQCSSHSICILYHTQVYERVGHMRDLHWIEFAWIFHILSCRSQTPKYLPQTMMTLMMKSSTGIQVLPPPLPLEITMRICGLSWIESHAFWMVCTLRYEYLCRIETERNIVVWSKSKMLIQFGFISLAINHLWIWWFWVCLSRVWMLTTIE